VVIGSGYYFRLLDDNRRQWSTSTKVNFRIPVIGEYIISYNLQSVALDTKIIHCHDSTPPLSKPAQPNTKT
jgi:hypothetical protein